MANDKILIVNDNSQASANKGVLYIAHYFNSLVDRNGYYNAHPSELIQRETTTAVLNTTTNKYEYFLYGGNTGIHNESDWINIDALATGSKGEDGKSLMFKWNDSILQVKTTDPTDMNWVSSPNLKGTNGDSIESAQIIGEDLVFFTKEYKNNSLSEKRITGFIPTVKSSIILGHYMGMLTAENIPIGKRGVRGQWFKVGSSFTSSNKQFTLNAIAIINKDTESLTVEDFDTYENKIDELISKSLYLLNLGNSSINQVKDIRMQVDDDGKLTIKGYDSITNSYVDFATISKNSKFESIATKDGIYLEDEGVDGTYYSRLIGRAVTPNAISVGSSKKDLILVSKNPKIATSNIANQNVVIQVNPVVNTEKSIAEYKMYVTPSDSIDVKSISIKIKDNIGDYYISAKDVATNVQIYESRPIFEYNNGLEKQYLLSGDRTIISNSPFLLRAGETYEIAIKFANNVIVEGMNKNYKGEFDPTLTVIDYTPFKDSKVGDYWRISKDGTVKIDNVDYTVKAGNGLIVLEDITGTPSNFNDVFSLERTAYKVGEAPIVVFTPYTILNTDIFEFDEIAGKKYVDSIVKGGSDGEVFVKGNATTNNSVLITTKLNNDSQVEFKKLSDVNTNTYTDAIIKDISLPEYPSLNAELKRLKTGRVYKGTFDPTIESYPKLADAKSGFYWSVVKDGTLGTGSPLISIQGTNPLITDTTNGTTITRNVGKLLLNGSLGQNWVKGVFVNTTLMSFELPITTMFNGTQNTINTHIIESGFPTVTYGSLNASTVNECCATNGKTFVLVIRKDRLVTQAIDDFKPWLQANPLNLLYQLATPTTEPDTGTSVSLKSGNNIVCISDVVGAPTNLASFVIEPVPTFSDYIVATDTTQGLSGAVPSPPLGTEKWLSSKNKWSSLPIFNGLQDGVITRNVTITGNNFLRDDGTWQEINANVPIYKGATAIANGVTGTVPVATITEKDRAFFGDGTWRDVLTSTNNNTFTGINNFTRQLEIGVSSDNSQLKIYSTSGTPFSGTTVGNMYGLSIGSTAVGTLNTTNYASCGTVTGIKSAHAWWVNKTGAATRCERVMLLNENGQLLLNKSFADSTTFDIDCLNNIGCDNFYAKGKVQAKKGLEIGSIDGSHAFLSILDSKNISANRTFQLPNINGTIATDETVTPHFAISATATSSNGNRLAFVDYVFSANTSTVPIEDIAMRCPTSGNGQLLLASWMIQKLMGVLTAPNGVINGLLSGSWENSWATDTALFSFGKLGTNGANPTSTSSSIVKSTVTGSTPTSYIRLCLGKDISGTNVYWVNIAPTTDGSIQYETASSVWSPLSSGSVPLIRSSVGGFVLGTSPNVAEARINNNIPVVHCIPMRIDTNM